MRSVNLLCVGSITKRSVNLLCVGSIKKRSVNLLCVGSIEKRSVNLLCVGSIKKRSVNLLRVLDGVRTACTSRAEFRPSAASLRRAPSTTQETATAGCAAIRQAVEAQAFQGEVCEILCASWRETTHRQYETYKQKWKKVLWWEKSRSFPCRCISSSGLFDTSVQRRFRIIIIISPLTAKAVGAPQMISQPVSSIFPCSPLPSATWRTPGLSIS